MAVSKRRAGNALLNAVWDAHSVLDRDQGAVVLPESVSHYTDAAGALGILQGRQLWATDALFMNDETELRYAKPLLSAAWEQRDAELVPDPEARKVFWAAFSHAFARVEFDPKVHVVCFCEDGDLLSQWRGYGNAGGGYSIQFDTKMLRQGAQRNFGLSFHKVLYDRGSQVRLARELLEAGTASLRDFPAVDGSTRDYAAEQVGHALGAMAITFAMRIKDSAFREENEWRLVYQPPPSDVEAAPLTREFRAGARGVLPFVRIREATAGPTIPSLTPRSVTIGPAGANTTVAKRAMEFVLRDAHGPDVAVISSGIPLRA